MKKITATICAGLIASGFISTVNAGMIMPDNYVYISSPSNAQTPYLDPGNTDLTDGVITHAGWATGITYTEAYKYVGWQNYDPIITFNFASVVSIGSLTLWADDANGAFGVTQPTQVSMTMGGSTVVRNIPDQAGALPFGIDFNNLNLSGDSLTLTVEHGGQWTMISEVQFASPVPVPAAAWLFASGLIGLVGVARRRKEQV